MLRRVEKGSREWTNMFGVVLQVTARVSDGCRSMSRRPEQQKPSSEDGKVFRKHQRQWSAKAVYGLR